MGLFCLFVIIVSTFLFHNAGTATMSKGHKLKIMPLIVGIVLFSLLVGLRYNPVIDKDFLNYWYVAKYGSNFSEYDRFEIIPRLIADFVLFFKLPPSAWFVIMGMFLVVFTLFAAYRINKSYMPIVFYGLSLLYLSFDMNVMRQGVAISVFLCAVTYIEERNWKMFLIFMALAYGFHKSSLIWSLVFFLSFLNWEKYSTRNIFILIAIVVGGGVSFNSILPNFDFLTDLVGKGQISDITDMDLMVSENKGTGIGIFIRYLRWIVLMIFIPIIFKKTKDKRIIILFSIFVIGLAMDIFSMYSIILARVARYPQIVELLLYPCLFTFCKYNKTSRAIIYPMAIFQVAFLTYVLYMYLNQWNFVSLN